MSDVTLPRIVSPNLGCPEIVSLDALRDNGVELVLAVRREEDPNAAGYTVRAAPSYANGGQEFPLVLGDAHPLDDDALPAKIHDVSETRHLISETLRSTVFQNKARFWRFRLRLQNEINEHVFRRVNGNARSTLYDLALLRDGARLGMVKHALCVRLHSPQVRFVHLTDLHLAARNDMWEREINRTVHGAPGAPPLGFTNFNERLRAFIRWANASADAGELDFVLALGDLVDFVQPGFGKPQPGESNWQVVIDMLTGSAEEIARGNPGLRVPVFTTAGNHDWRPHPYPPEFNGPIFGLTKEQASKLDYLYYDPSEVIGKKVAEVHSKLIREGSPILARTWWRTTVLSVLPRLERLWERFWTRFFALAGKYVWHALGVLWSALLVGGVPLHWLTLAKAFMIGAGTVALLLLRNWFGDKLRQKITALIGIETSVDGLRDYFLQLNPYFNYAFRLENCYFLVLDTGHDCLTGQSFWDDGGKKLGPVSVRDNIIGGSPDTMAFYPPSEYYHYSQIAWLEAVLASIQGQQHGQLAGEPRNCRVFAGVHAPPANLSAKARRKADRELARSQGDRILLRRGWLRGFDIRWGTINHFLSEFYYLCLGYRETAQQNLAGPGIDVVLAGHAHWSVEFKLRRPQNAAAAWKPDLLYGRFSQAVEAAGGGPHQWWGPLLLQTGACGPPSPTDPHTPNFRYIVVDHDLAVRPLRVTHLP